MFEMLAACLFASIGNLGPGDWWNAEWSARATLTVDSGFYERQDLVFSRAVNFDEWLKKAGVDGAFDANSPRVLWLHDGRQEEVPSRFIPDKGAAAQGTLKWQRPGIMAPMVREQFFIYFDALQGTPKPAPKPCSLEAPGNLVVNGGFEEADPKDPARPLGWEFQAKSDDGAIERVKGISHFGQACLRVTNTQGGSSEYRAAQWVKVRAGRRYILSAWTKCTAESQGGQAVVTAWFYGPDRKYVPAKGGVYENYKIQMGCHVYPGYETPWTHVSSSSPSLIDPALRADIVLPQGRLAPGTGSALITVSAFYGKMSAYFDDVEFKEVRLEGEPVEIVMETVEKR